MVEKFALAKNGRRGGGGLQGMDPGTPLFIPHTPLFDPSSTPLEALRFQASGIKP